MKIKLYLNSASHKYNDERYSRIGQLFYAEDVNNNYYTCLLFIIGYASLLLMAMLESKNGHTRKQGLKIKIGRISVFFDSTFE
jgi:hypothetical protein